jgi:phage terminase large subunit-like protein
VADFGEALVPIAKDSIGGLSGEPISFRPWQRNLLRHALARKADGTYTHRFFMVGAARKNGKTALLSTVPLALGLFGDQGGEIYSAAADRDQAKLVMAHAKRAVEMSPMLAEQIKVFRDTLEFKPTGTIWRALSSEAYTKEGLSATLVLADELAAWPNRDLFDVLSLSMGARRSPLFLAITTAGQRTDQTGMDSIAYTLYQLARRRISGEHEDPTLGMAWYEAEEDAYLNPEKWGQANPGLLSTPPLLSLEDLTSAKMRTPEAEFRTKRLNQFAASGQAFLPAGTWDACADTSLQLQDGDSLVLGFDGSFSADSTGIVGVRTTDSAVFVLGLWERPIDDLSWRVPVEQVEMRMEEICKTYDVREINCDPFRWQSTMERWQAAGLPVVEHPQSPARMTPATASFYDAVVNGRLKHDGDPRLTRHVGNATPYTTRYGVQVRKGKDAGKKIDLCVALIMCWGRAATLGATPAEKPRASVAFIEL